MPVRHQLETRIARIHPTEGPTHWSNSATLRAQAASVQRGRVYAGSPSRRGGPDAEPPLPREEPHPNRLQAAAARIIALRPSHSAAGALLHDHACSHRMQLSEVCRIVVLDHAPAASAPNPDEQAYSSWFHPTGQRSWRRIRMNGEAHQRRPDTLFHVLLHASWSTRCRRRGGGNSGAHHDDRDRADARTISRANSHMGTPIQAILPRWETAGQRPSRDAGTCCAR
jgi:hypothetical protein